MRRSTIGVLALCALAIGLAGCATIMSGSSGQSQISSTPTGATFTILRNGREYHTGRTPQVVDLPKRGKYSIRMAMEGYEPVEMRMKKGVSGWYIGGNILFGGLIGWLIVDPATGAMFTLPDVDIKLVPKANTAALAHPAGDGGLMLLSLGDIPPELRGRLVPVTGR